MHCNVTLFILADFIYRLLKTNNVNIIINLKYKLQFVMPLFFSYIYNDECILIH